MFKYGVFFFFFFLVNLTVLSKKWVLPKTVDLKKKIHNLKVESYILTGGNF